MSQPNGTTPNGTTLNGHLAKPAPGFPIAICGMALRLPGGLESPQQLWDFLLAKGDARGRVPESRYNITAFHSDSGLPGTIVTEYGYFLDDSVKLGALDTSRFSLSRAELEFSDPQQRLMLEVVRECFDDAGEVGFKGGLIGCYMGSYSEDWMEMQNRDHQQSGINRVDGYSDFMVSSRISYEMDLRGPSMTIRTACSSALVGLHESCLAIQRGDCDAAIVGGANLIIAPGMTASMTEKGVLSPEGSCKTFSADADGYARGEAITAVFIKPLDAAIRDGNPIRAVIRSTMCNNDGKTPGITHPSSESQEAMIRQAYRAANITDFSKTAFVECHGTGTPIGDPIEANAVAQVFGDSGVYIGSVKPNLGHSEGASGLTSLMKAVLSLQNRTIPPNIKFSSPNPNIPFLDSRLVVPLEPVPWPESRLERVSVNSFGIGGTNAHVVLDSARSFNVFSPSTGPCSANPQLLLLSANSAASLNNVILNFQDWVSKAPDNLEDLAYTLANKREHLSHRAFMVAGKDRPSVVSQGRRTTGPPPDLVFVFTGQGAQWPRMGRELLLRSDLLFQSRIRSLDKYLQGAVGAPQWTLEEELLKSGKASGVQMAELSQPLCTAVQIALVDLFAAAGVEPSAVVGHSSGEIAAAYATGALTAREGIFAAWQRGIAAKKQTKSGAMAAVGLGWDEVKPFLVTDVVVACENSSRSVTLSGDASKIQETVLSIKKSYPDVMARLLKVDKAYHSYHMREVGQDYCSEMKRHLVGKRPQKPFFSSVTGKQINEPLDAAYWQNNLESPVLFNSAVSGILGSFKNVAFLEIGPHGALAGPLRQILTHASASAPYVSAMTRGEDCVESFLTAVGKLFELTISVDFKSLMPTGRCLSDLPHYPWDHDSDYWRESRISHEWRYREFASHPLLGIRQLESTSLEPSWRNILYVDNVSWLRDHKIEGNIIFPCAGYIAMAGEAIRQITGSDVTFTVRNMVLSSAMLLTERNPAEMVTTFRPYRLTDLLNSKAWEFSIASHNGHVWTRHCTGQVTSEAIEPTPVPCTTTLPRKVERRRYYRALTQAGVGLGPRFQRFADIRTNTAQHLATVKLRSDVNEDDDRYYLHPTIVDACIQSAALAATNGRVDVKYYRRIPTKVDRVTVRRCASDSDMMVLASATFSKSSGDVVGRVSCIAHGKTVVEMEGAKLSPLEEAEAEEADNLHITARLEWGPHIDFLNAADLIKPSYPRELYSPSLDEMVRLCFVYSDRRIERNQASSTHMQKYQTWIKRQVLLMGEDSPMRAFEDTAILDEVDSFVRQLSDSPVAACAATVQKVVSNIDGLFSGKIDGLEMLLADDTLTQVLATDACDKSQFIRHLAHSKPNLRILEIGAGTGASTASMLKDLALPTGQPLYSKYTFTDISSAFFVSAKDHFKSHRNIEYRILDITRDPVEQGFEVTEKYDLIIATNVIHATKSLGESLRNVHKLLDPNGRLLLHELNSPSKLPNFIFGLLPGWWYGESDGRAQEPYVDPARWQSELTSAGFGGLDAVVLDGEEPHQLNAIMVAKPQVGLTKKKAVTLLCDVNQEHAGSLSRNLESRGYTVNQCRLDDELPESQDVISLLDSSHAIFENINVCRYEAFQQMLNGLGGGSGILWITHACQVQCEDPSYAQIIGVARTIRTEMLLDFATCEVDDIGTSLDRIVEVFARFQERREDDALKADFEYAITKGTVNVGRIYPFSLKDELLLETTPEDQVVLDLAKPGRLETLQWTPRETKPLSGDEVEIKIYAAGLNFKDVLGALGVVPVPEEGLGLEASGIVSRVGPEVRELCLGDRVILLGSGTLSTLMTISETLCEKIPSNLSFEDAATMPTVFTTAVCGLLNIGNLQKGQSVLIHSAAGGVGLAAMQLARMIGAEVYATVGSEEKAKYLMETFGLPRNRIFHSRDASFVDGLMRETNGKGADLVLNSLSGELLHATWHCVAEFGKLVEIGKRDLLGGGRLEMDVFLASRSYSCIYLDQLVEKRKYVCKEILHSVIGLLREGHITPIKPVKVFDASLVQDAFRHLQQGQHIGKIVIALRDIDGSVKSGITPAKTAKQLKLDKTASYLLVGGLGGIGRAVSRHLVEHNARCLVFLSRNAGSGPEDHDFIEELKSMGCDVRLVKGSVTNIDDVSRAVHQARNLKGIMQCSMVLQDQAFPRMSLFDWKTATAPKVEGTWNLHNATLSAGIDLDFFVLFSSMSGVTGQAGQANYAGANTFLDSFVQYRTHLGLAAASIDIGAVQDVGYVSQDDTLLRRMQVASALGTTEPELMEAITAAILRSPASTAGSDTPDQHFVDPNTMVLGLGTAIPLSSPESRVFWRKDRRMAVYHNSSKVVFEDTASSHDRLKSFLATARHDASMLKSGETADFLAREIGKKLFSFLLKPEEDLNTTLSLSQLGVDSLVGVEMRSWWREVFNSDISVLELLGQGNLDSLGKHAAARLLKALGDDN